MTNTIQVAGYTKNLRPVRTFTGGVSVFSFTIAELAWSKDRGKHQVFWNVSMFDKLAERMGAIVQEGMHITVFGHVVERISEKDGVKKAFKNIHATDVALPPKDRAEYKEHQVAESDDNEIPF